MWWNVGPHLHRRIRAESARGSTSTLSSAPPVYQGAALEELQAILKAKFGSLVRAWRVGLDQDDSGLLTFREFSQALHELGYVGNVRTLWFQLDSDGSGFVSLKELDEPSYYALEQFRMRCTQRYGTIQDCWHQLLDRDNSGTVSHEEFFEAARELGYRDDEELWELFNFLLVRPGVRFITLPDIKFLQGWEEAKQRTMYRRRLPVSWVNKDPYLRIPGTLSNSDSIQSSKVSLLPSLPDTQWSAVEEDCGDMVAIDQTKEKETFRAFLVEKYGSLAQAFEVMDANNSGTLSLVEFQTVVSAVLKYCRPREARRLFLSFNQDPDALLDWEELGVEKYEWVQHKLRKRMLKRNARGMNKVLSPLGHTPRMQQGFDTHIARTRRTTSPKKAVAVAFGAPLPRGWGPPPGFEPAQTSRGGRGFMATSLDTARPWPPVGSALASTVAAPLAPRGGREDW